MSCSRANNSRAVFIILLCVVDAEKRVINYRTYVKTAVGKNHVTPLLITNAQT